MEPNFSTDTKAGDVVKAFLDNAQKRHVGLNPIKSEEQQKKTTSSKLIDTSLGNEPVVLTGMGQSRLSATTAEALASGDAAALILLGKSQIEIQSVFDEINYKYPRVKVIFITLDMSKLSSVRGAADVIRKLEVPIDGIIGYPVLMAAPWAMTADGIEAHFHVNYLSHFVLVNRLLDRVSDEGSIVMVTSSIRPDAPALKFDDPNFSNGATYHSLEGYAQSMFANVEFAKCLATSGAGRSMTAFSVNPGNTKNNLHTSASSEQVASWLQRKKEAGEDLPLLLQQAPKSLSQGCATILRALLDPNLKARSGAFLDNCQVRSLPYIDFPAGKESARQLWKWSEELVKEEYKRF